MRQNYTDVLIEEYERLHEEEVKTGVTVAKEWYQDPSCGITLIQGNNLSTPITIPKKYDYTTKQLLTDVPVDISSAASQIYSSTGKSTSLKSTVSQIYSDPQKADYIDKINCTQLYNFLSTNEQTPIDAKFKLLCKEFITRKQSNGTLYNWKASGNVETPKYNDDANVNRVLSFVNANALELAVQTAIDNNSDYVADQTYQEKNNTLTRSSVVKYEAIDVNAATKLVAECDLKITSPKTETSEAKSYRVEIKIVKNMKNLNSTLKKGHEADIILAYFANRTENARWVAFVPATEIDTDSKNLAVNINSRYAQASAIKRTIDSKYRVFDVAVDLENLANGRCPNYNILAVAGNQIILKKMEQAVDSAE